MTDEAQKQTNDNLPCQLCKKL